MCRSQDISRKGKEREKGKASIMHVKRKKEEDSHLMGCRSRGRGRQLKRSAERTAAAAAAPTSSCLRDLLLSFFLRRLSLCLSFLYAHSSLSLSTRESGFLVSLCVCERIPLDPFDRVIRATGNQPDVLEPSFCLRFLSSPSLTPFAIYSSPC